MFKMVTHAEKLTLPGSKSIDALLGSKERKK